MTGKSQSKSQSEKAKARFDRPSHRAPAKKTSRAKPALPSPGAPTWKLEEAKAKFSEVVRRARAEGPQYVTVRGEPSVAVIDVAELEKLLPAKEPRLPFVPFMESLFVEGLDLSRDADAGRDVEL